MKSSYDLPSIASRRQEASDRDAAATATVVKQLGWMFMAVGGAPILLLLGVVVGAFKKGFPPLSNILVLLGLSVFGAFICQVGRGLGVFSPAARRSAQIVIAVLLCLPGLFFMPDTVKSKDWFALPGIVGIVTLFMYPAVLFALYKLNSAAAKKLFGAARRGHV